jgi:tripartite-type tricarboxylate transporter receptor subunit TctC
MLIPHFLAALCAGFLALVGDMAFGQDYPNKPIRIITGGAGGGTDFTARLIAQGISVPLGQPVVVENRGAGIIPVEFVSKAAPDGYTLLVQGSVAWVSPLVLQKAPYEILRDFAPISQIERTVFVVTVHPSIPVKSVSELIALAKSKPAALNYGSGPSGTTSHLAVELFKSLAGVNIVWVPYKGVAQAITDQISGEVHMTIIDSSGVMPHVKAGKLKALAVTSATPSALVPGLPTVAATGVPGYEAAGMSCIWAPAGTPAPIINRLSQEIVRLLNRADVKERFLNAGVEPVGSSPEQFAATMRSDIARISKVIKDAGIKVN